ncbi:MAG: hypothetical protein LBU90_01320 [Bacteroidales bacterium]|jgi:hypothetical protein|nr:hypothetical protein [Bacteroidales bacterium]
MSKRIISSIIIVCLLGIVVFVYIRLKQSNQSFENAAFETVPQQVAVVVEVKKAVSLEDFAENSVWCSFSLSPLFAPMKTVATLVQTALQNETTAKNFSENPLIISFMECKEGTQDYLLSVPLLSADQITQAHDVLKNLFSSLQKTQYSFDYGTHIYSFETAEKKRKLSYAIFKNTLILSPSHVLVETAITACKEGQNILSVAGFTKIKKTAGKQTVANAYVDLSRVTQFFMPLKTAPQAAWLEFDVSVRSRAISLNGFSQSELQSQFLSVFRAQTPIKLQLSAVAPAHSSYFKVWGVSNVAQFRTNYEEFLTHNGNIETYKKQLQLLKNTFGSDIAQDLYSIVDSEIAFVCGAQSEGQSEEHYAFVKTISQSQAEEMLAGWLKSSNAPQSTFSLDTKTVYAVYHLPAGNLLQVLWGDLFAEGDFSYITFVNNYMIFANSQVAVEKLLTAYELKKVLANDSDFKKFQNNVLPSFSVYEYGVLGKMGNAHTPVQQILSEEHAATQRTNAFALQIVAQNGLFYNALHIDFSEGETAVEKPAAENIVWESVLDAELASQPQIFEIQSGEFGILLQDAKNTLYLLNAAGKIQWKKSLPEALISPLFQVDYFKNGKYQYLANSANYVYCIDRLGNFVENYPHKLEDSTAIAMSVFDYENTKDYRLFVPAGRKLYLYNIKMQKNKEWAWNESESEIVVPVQHFVNAGKDYIVCADRRNVYLLTRKGELRAKSKEQFEKSAQTPFYYQKNTQHIVTTDIHASVKSISFDGVVKTLKENTLPKNHYFLHNQSSNEYALVSEKECGFYTASMIPIRSYTLKFAPELVPQIVKKSSFVVGIVDASQKTLYFYDIKEGQLPLSLHGKTEFANGKLQKNSQKLSIIIGTGGNTVTNYNY